MRLLLGSTLLLAATAAIAASAPTLDEKLAGRTSGSPRACIMQSQIDHTDITDGAILYHMRGGDDYLNRPGGCSSTLQPGRGIVSRTWGGSICRGDIIDVRDFSIGTTYGSCGLGDFTPYPRAKKGQ